MTALKVAQLMHTYRLYGLNIRSEMPLSGVLPGGDGLDVLIRRGSFDLPPIQRSRSGIGFHVDEETVYFRWEMVGSFRIHAGRQVDIIPDPQVEDTLLERYITGPVLGTILYQRRHLILHGSAVALHGGAVAFLGESGWGKSTLAAHFHTRGSAVITDDIVAIRIEDDTHLVYPGISEVRLWPDSVTSLRRDPAEQATEMPGSEKQVYHIGAVVQPLPLTRLYLLGQGPRHEIQPVTAAETAIELVRHTYGVRLLRTIRPALHFQHCLTIARAVPTYRLCRHLSLNHLPELLDLIEDNLAHED